MGVAGGAVGPRGSAGSAGSAAGATLEESIAAVRSRLADACARSDRPRGDVVLVAVTKSIPLELIRRARAAGIEDFGENYAAELAERSAQMPATWHFIGKLQSGTAARVAAHADLIHSAEPGRALERVAARAARHGRSIPCLVQVDFTGRRQGVDPDGVQSLVESTAALEGIRFTGLMTLPPWTGDAESARPYFARLRELRDRLRKGHPDLRELSMGMSGDYEVAAEEGATMVRVGTALFGPRPVRAASGGLAGPGLRDPS